MNQLQHETSPYLLQHAHNPVNWYAWSPEVLAMAQEQDKPILVSIGYSTCHWCHVMERESFESEEVAHLMNECFINIKVDREERPDIDQIYMEACQIISGNGGWPLNCFLTPDGRPFFAGTYYPPTPAHGRPSWRQVLLNIHNAFTNKRQVVEDQANQLTDIINNGESRLVNNQIENVKGESPFPENFTSQIYFNLHNRFDSMNGGFGGAPKFPGAMNIDFLFQYHHFSNYEEAEKHALLSLDKMIRGGIYDQIGGGFARYATDDRWLIPHFEKMLYDNALLVSVLADAYTKTKKFLYKEAITDTLEWVAREMTHQEGGFYSALDADSEGVEGKFYIWDKEEIEAALGDFAKSYCRFYDVSKNGNWEGTNILNRPVPLVQFAKEQVIQDIEEFKKKIEEANKKLLSLRAKRIRPGLDDKILLDWNALMITAYAKAYRALGNEEYKATAVRALAFLFENFEDKTNGKWWHTFKDGKAKHDAFLNDYAFLVEALTEVYSITFDLEYLEKAGEIMDIILTSFKDEASPLFYFTAQNQEQLIARRKEIYDAAIPSGNATMVLNLQRLSIYLGRRDYQTRATRMLQSVSEAILKYPSSFGRWAKAILHETEGIKEIAIVGPQAKEKLNTIWQDYLPSAVWMASEKSQNDYPLLANKPESEDTYIYVCQNFVCSHPVLSWADAKEVMWNAVK